MAASTFPALAIHTEGESPINLLAKAEQIKSAQQSQEMGQIQLQEARLKQQSQQVIMSAWAANNGDPDKTLQAVANSGKALPEDVINLQTHFVDLKTKAALLSDKDLEVQAKQNAVLYNSLQSYQALPPEQRTPAKLQEMMANLASQNIPIDRFVPTFKALAQNSSDATLKPIEYSLVGQEKVLAAERAQREEASAPTVGQAQAKTQAELSEAIDKAAAAHIALLSQPSPTEAKTERVAKLLQTQAETAAANATTAQKRAETALLGAQPVFAFDQATNQRVLTTMPDAKAKGYTNPVKVSEADINKEVEATKQFNDVQMNVSRYKNAFKASSTPITGDQAVSMERIISDKDLAGMVGNVFSPQFFDALNKGRIASDWNNLSPENQDLAMGYFRSKGSIIAYQKALTQVGRTSKEAMEIEMNNLPSPLEGGTVGLKRLQSFQQNIDTATQGQTRVPWLPTTTQIRQGIEGEFDRNRPQRQELFPDSILNK